MCVCVCVCVCRPPLQHFHNVVEKFKMEEGLFVKFQQQQGDHLVPQHPLTPSLLTFPPSHFPHHTGFLFFT